MTVYLASETFSGASSVIVLCTVYTDDDEGVWRKHMHEICRDCSTIANQIIPVLYQTAPPTQQCNLHFQPFYVK